MTADIVSLVFIIGAVVLLVMLWRRGPQKRGAFFVAGLLVVGTSFALVLSEDALEQGLGDAYREWRAGWSVEPAEALVASTGVGVTFRGDVAVAAADPAEHTELHPEPESALQWSPLYAAEGPHGGCALIDATDYAAALDFGRLEDAVYQELGALDQAGQDSLVVRLSRTLPGARRESVASGILDLPQGRAAYIDLDGEGGSSQRHYIIRAQGRWIVLTCHATSADGVPAGRWVSIASSLEVSGNRPNVPSSASNGTTAYDANGVSVTVPSSWRVRDAGHGDFTWMQPGFRDTTRWDPLFHVRADTVTCSLVDATDYADQLAFAGLDDALEWELAGFRDDATTTAPRDRLARRTTRFQSDDATASIIETSSGEMGVIEAAAWRGWITRHYLIERAGRWLYLTCDSDQPPDDRWLSIAESITIMGEDGTTASPTPRPTLPASLKQVEAALREAAPFADCRWRQPGTVRRSVAVVTCRAEGLGEVTYAQFRDLEGLERWWDTEASAVSTMSAPEASERCRDGQAAEAKHGEGRVICRQKGLRARVSWTDVDNLRAIIATSGSLPLASLYERWEQGRIEPSPNADLAPDVEPTEAPAQAMGLVDPASLFPGGWAIEAADPVEDIVFYPRSGSEAWTPILVAGIAGQECVLIDATDYARAMSFDGIEDALDAELDAWDPEPDDRSERHLVPWISLMPPAGIDGEVIEASPASRVAPGMELAFIDIGDDSLLERHYLLHDDTGWAYLTCLFDAPDDRWLSIAMKLAEHPLDTVLAPLTPPAPTPTPRPTATTTAAATLDPTVWSRQRVLQARLPFGDCEDSSGVQYRRRDRDA